MKDDDSNEIRQVAKDEMANLQRAIDQHQISGSKNPMDAFDSLLFRLRKAKPDDRSEEDRYYAIVITEVEKAKAVYMAYCRMPGTE